MASLVPIAHAARPPRATQLIGAALLLVLALVPWRHGERIDGACTSQCGDASIAPDSVPRLTIEIPVPAGALPNGWVDTDFPDSRAWPTGMVIGLRQKIDDPMVLRRSGLLDSLLSALKAALLSIQS